MKFLVAIWKLVTAPCAGRKYQTATERYLSIWCSTVFVSFWNHLCVYVWMHTNTYFVHSMNIRARMQPMCCIQCLCLQTRAGYCLKCFNSMADASFWYQTNTIFDNQFWKVFKTNSTNCTICVLCCKRIIKVGGGPEIFNLRLSKITLIMQLISCSPPGK